MTKQSLDLVIWGSQLSSHHFILSLKTTGWQGGLQLLWQCIVWSSIFAPNIFAPNILKLIWCGGRECYGREQGCGSQLFSHLPAGHPAIYNAHMLLNLNFVHFLKVFVSKFHPFFYRATTMVRLWRRADYLEEYLNTEVLQHTN